MPHKSLVSSMMPKYTRKTQHDSLRCSSNIMRPNSFGCLSTNWLPGDSCSSHPVIPRPLGCTSIHAGRYRLLERWDITLEIGQTFQHGSHRPTFTAVLRNHFLAESCYVISFVTTSLHSFPVLWISFYEYKLNKPNNVQKDSFAANQPWNSMCSAPEADKNNEWKFFLKFSLQKFALAPALIAHIIGLYLQVFHARNVRALQS